MDLVGTLILGPLAGLLTSVAGQLGYRRFKQRNQAALLNFGSRMVTFVYSPRRDSFSEPQRVILPRTSTEDFLAINNLISALIRSGYKHDLDMCSVRAFDGNKRFGDLVFVCSPVSNPGTASVLAELSKIYESLPRFETQSNGQCVIHAGANTYQSETYEVVERCHKEGSEPEEATMRDYGLLVKAPNPWEPERMVLVLAGIRGIGTWGIAECLKKDWQKVLRKKRRDGKHRASGPFAAVIETTFDKCDLTSFEVKYLLDLD